VHREVLPDPAVAKRIAQRWGDTVFDEAGRVSRRRLGEVVFANDEARVELEEIVLPEVYRIWRERLAAGPADARWVFEVPLLFEQQLENWFDFTVCVASSADVQ